MDTNSCRRKRAAAVLVISCCSELLATEQPKEQKKRMVKNKGQKGTLREEILAGRKFGGFGGFCPKPPN